MAKTSNPSLWWRLSWQLSLVIVAVVAIVIIGLCVWATTIMSPNMAMEETVSSVIGEAARRDDHGNFEIGETPALQTLKQQNNTLWFVAATTGGDYVSYGPIPPPYAALAGMVHLFDDADIRGSALTAEIATIDSADSPIGEVRILSGGASGKGWPVLALFLRAYPIYVSLIAIALPAIFLTVPHIVGRALARVSDVAQKAAEIQPRRPEARLPIDGVAREVTPLVIAINGALDRLEGEYRKRQRFLIDAAHELRTPIAIMQTRIDGMSEGIERQRMLKDVARLADTAEQLLAFERNDQATDLHEAVDLVEIAQTVVADLAPMAIGAGYQISLQSDLKTLERHGNLQSLERALSNLVRNAIEYGGNVGAITISVSADGRIRVTDEGRGIPDDQQELVFEPFYRVAPSSKGAGLGLSLVKQIVEDHGGDVILKSGSEGTEITIRL